MSIMKLTNLIDLGKKASSLRPVYGIVFLDARETETIGLHILKYVLQLRDVSKELTQR